MPSGLLLELFLALLTVATLAGERLVVVLVTFGDRSRRRAASGVADAGSSARYARSRS